MKIFSPSITGSLLVTGSVAITGSFQVQLNNSVGDVFLIKNNLGQNLLIVSQSGLIQFATQSTNPVGTTTAGSIWFTSASLYVGLE